MKLQINKLILLLATSAFVAGGCKKIEITPQNIVPPGDAFKTEADLTKALAGAYAQLREGGYYGERFPRVAEYLSDRIDGSTLSGYEADIYNFKSSADNGTGDNYSNPYITIQRANTVLENLSLGSSDAIRNRYEGEAKFLRALGHFDAVKFFAQPYGFTTDNSHAGIVIKTMSSFEGNRTRNTVAQVYAAVINDLRSAESLLPVTTGNYYANRNAARALLARVYFQMNKFDSAYYFSNLVITTGTAIFDNSAAFVTQRYDSTIGGVIKNPEAIFTLGNEANAFLPWGGLRGTIDTLNIGLRITLATYTAGTLSNDRRKVWYSNNAGTYGIKKYKSPKFVLPLLHITEMKLIRAESAAELNQNLTVAISDINDITNRAYGGTVAPLPGGASAAQVKSLVRDQRKLEMIFEGDDRLQQVKRIGARGETSNMGTAAWNCYGLVLQFPASEVNINTNFTPNPQGNCSR